MGSTICRSDHISAQLALGILGFQLGQQNHERGDPVTGILAIIGIVAKLLESVQNKTANEIGTDVQAADAAVLVVLQENARIKGATIDWSDPAAVQAFVVDTLPKFTPIPEPGAGGGGVTQ